MASRLADAGQKLKAAERSGDPWTMHQAEARVRRFSDLLKKWKQSAGSLAGDGSPVRLEVQVLRIGALAIVAMPGEMFAEIGVAIKKASPFAFTMFAGYSSGTGGGYMPTEAEYAFGGYEIERTPYGRRAAQELIEQATALFDEVR